MPIYKIGVKRHGERVIMINAPNRFHYGKWLEFSYPPKKGEPQPMAIQSSKDYMQTYLTFEDNASREAVMKKIGAGEGFDFFDYEVEQ